MSEFKGTPGPWFLFGNPAHCVGGPHPENGTGGVAMCGMRLRSADEAEANARLIAAAPEMFDLLTGPHWLVWSNEHRAWWGPAQRGYCWDVTAAGRYTLEEALEISKERGVYRGDGVNPPELVQPSPEWLTARSAAVAKAKGEP